MVAGADNTAHKSKYRLKNDNLDAPLAAYNTHLHKYHGHHCSGKRLKESFYP